MKTSCLFCVYFPPAIPLVFNLIKGNEIKKKEKKEV